MASPENAICDLLYTKKPLKNPDDVLGFLFEGMRIEEDDFYSLDMEKICFLSELYKYSNLFYLKEAISWPQLKKYGQTILLGTQQKASILQIVHLYQSGVAREDERDY